METTALSKLADPREGRPALLVSRQRLHALAGLTWTSVIIWIRLLSANCSRKADFAVDQPALYRWHWPHIDFQPAAWPGDFSSRAGSPASQKVVQNALLPSFGSASLDESCQCCHFYIVPQSAGAAHDLSWIVQYIWYIAKG